MKNPFVIISRILLLALGGYIWMLYPFAFLDARPAIGEEQWLEVDNRTLAYYVRGEGPRILLAASLGREVSDFNELVRDLNAAGFRTVSIEAPGIGNTDMLEKPTSLYKLASDIKAVADHDIAKTGDRETVALIGHAFGNRVMRATASKYPHLAKSVILVAAGGQREIAEKAKEELRNSLLPYLPASRREQAINYAFFAEGNEAPDFWLRGWHTKTALLQASTLEHTEDTHWQNAGGLPILIVQALEDVIAPKVDVVDPLQERLGDQLEVVLVKNASHALFPEQPDVISKAILNFLELHRIE